MRIPRHKHRLVAFQGYFYAIGGISDRDPVRSCERIRVEDVEEGEWERGVPDMNRPRKDFAAMVFNGGNNIIVFGHGSKTAVYNNMEVEIFSGDPLNKWSTF